MKNIEKDKYMIKKICSDCGCEYSVSKYTKAKTFRCRICSRISKPKENSRIFVNTANLQTFLKNRKKYYNNSVLVNNGYLDSNTINNNF